MNFNGFYAVPLPPWDRFRVSLILYLAREEFWAWRFTFRIFCIQSGGLGIMWHEKVKDSNRKKEVKRKRKLWLQMLRMDVFQENSVNKILLRYISGCYNIQKEIALVYLWYSPISGKYFHFWKQHYYNVAIYWHRFSYFMLSRIICRNYQIIRYTNEAYFTPFAQNSLSRFCYEHRAYKGNFKELTKHQQSANTDFVGICRRWKHFPIIKFLFRFFVSQKASPIVSSTIRRLIEFENDFHILDCADWW